MIAVDLITEQELDKRFDSLSNKLKEALTSERSLSAVDQICEKNKITEEDRLTTIHQLVGLTILGLIHSYDLGSEINEALSLDNPKFGIAIAEELNAKVFLPIKTELENGYHPLTVASSIKDSILEKKPTPDSRPPEVMQGKSDSSSQPKVMPLSNKGVTSYSAPTAPATPKPTILSDVGWSKASSTGPGITLTPAIPIATKASAPMPSTPPTPSMPAPTPAPKPSEPVPVMLHEDTTFKAAEKNAKFTFSQPGAGGDANGPEHDSRHATAGSVGIWRSETTDASR